MSASEIESLQQRLSELEREVTVLRESIHAVSPYAPPIGRWASTWSPFQSPEVQAICANLTEVERRRLITNAQNRGSEIAMWLTFPVLWFLCCLVFTLLEPSFTSIVCLTAASVHIGFFCVPRLRRMRQRVRELLCDTDFSRRNGYTPTSLQLESFPWQR